MNLEDFIERYHCMPHNELEFAKAAARVYDCRQLRAAAETYLAARETFLLTLNGVQVEIG